MGRGPGQNNQHINTASKSFPQQLLQGAWKCVGKGASAEFKYTMVF